MQPRAWYFRTPEGSPIARASPSFTEFQAKVCAARLAIKRPGLEPETALIL